jgi:polar amino acid transport system substrate-binding protein
MAEPLLAGVQPPAAAGAATASAARRHWQLGWLASLTLCSLGSLALLVALLLPCLLPGLAAALPLPIQHTLAAVQPEPNWRRQPQGAWQRGVQQRGLLVAAVRYYPRPAPPEAPSPATPDGLDLALAHFLADKLGVKLELQAHDASGRRPDLWLTGHGPESQPGQDASRYRAVHNAYRDAPGRLTVLKGSHIAQAQDLRDATVCLQQGSPYAQLLAQRWQARPRFYPSGIHAISGFMAGECLALAEDEAAISRLLQRDEWRFYRQLPQTLSADPRQPDILLLDADPESVALLDRLVHHWRLAGALLQARQQRVADLALELTQLGDGLICHS